MQSNFSAFSPHDSTLYVRINVTIKSDTVLVKLINSVKMQAIKSLDSALHLQTFCDQMNQRYQTKESFGFCVRSLVVRDFDCGRANIVKIHAANKPNGVSIRRQAGLRKRNETYFVVNTQLGSGSCICWHFSLFFFFYFVCFFCFSLWLRTPTSTTLSCICRVLVLRCVR